MNRRRFLTAVAAATAGTRCLRAASNPGPNFFRSIAEARPLQRIEVRFAHPLDPPGARLGHLRDSYVARKEYRFAPAHVYLQTADSDGFVHPYARADWESATACGLDILRNEPMAIEATCRVEGFGEVICRADNEGRLYDPAEWREGQRFLFDLEAAKSQLAACRRRLDHFKADGMTFEEEILQRLNLAVDQLARAQAAFAEENVLAAANRSLAHSLAAGEKIELSAARRRLAGQPRRAFSFGSFLYGDVYYWLDNARYRELYAGLFNSGSVSFNWPKTAEHGSDPSRFNWAFEDKAYGFIRDLKLEGIGHCLGWQQAIPEWCKSDPLHFTDNMLALARATVERYSDVTRCWSVMNEALDWMGYFVDQGWPLERRVELFAKMSGLIRELDPKSAIESDTCVTNGAYRMTRPDLKIGAWDWYQGLDAAGIDFALGLQIYHGGGEYATFDLARLAHQIEMFCRLGRPLHLYLETPGSTKPDNLRLKVNGAWHGEWSEALQADWWESFMTILLANPQVLGVTPVSLSQKNINWMPQGALCDGELRQRPSYDRLRKLMASHVDLAARVNWNTHFKQG